MQTVPAHAYELGTPTAAYTRSTKSKVALVVLIVIFVACGFVFIVASTQEPDTLSKLGLMAFGLAFIALPLAFGWVWFQNRDWQVLVFPAGVADTRHGKTTTFRWDDVQAVWQSITRRYYNGVYAGTTYVYTVQLANGTKLKFDNSLKNIETLGNTIQHQVFNRQFPRAVEIYNSGGTVTFGNLSVSQRGLSNGKETLPWNQIKGVTVKQGFLSVSKQGKWLRWDNTNVAKIPNFYIFTALVDQIVGFK